jgi:hypothetical protein
MRGGELDGSRENTNLLEKQVEMVSKFQNEL